MTRKAAPPPLAPGIPPNTRAGTQVLHYTRRRGKDPLVRPAQLVWAPFKNATGRWTARIALEDDGSHVEVALDHLELAQLAIAL